MPTPTTPLPQMIQLVVQKYFAASRSNNKADNMAACFAENCIHHDPAEAPALTSPAEVRQFLQAIANLFASVELTEDFMTVNGQEVAVKWTGRGIGQNGREVTFEGIDVFEINQNGQIQSLRAYWNPSALLPQLQNS